MSNAPRNAIVGQPIDTEPDVERRRAFLAAYFDTGSQTKACTVAGVHISTAQKWMRNAWFGKALDELKREKDKKLDGHITRILGKALKALEDRVEHGDEKVWLTKDGDILREKVEMTAKDLAVVTGVLFDKRAAIRKEPDSLKEDASASALERIADKLRQYATEGNRRDIVDVEARPVGGSDA